MQGPFVLLAEWRTLVPLGGFYPSRAQSVRGGETVNSFFVAHFLSGVSFQLLSSSTQSTKCAATCVPLLENLVQVLTQNVLQPASHFCKILLLESRALGKLAGATVTNRVYDLV